MLADTQIYRRHDTEEPETIRSMASLSILNWLEPSKVQQSLAVTDGRFCQGNRQAHPATSVAQLLSLLGRRSKVEKLRMAKRQSRQQPRSLNFRIGPLLATEASPQEIVKLVFRSSDIFRNDGGQTGC